MPAFRHLESSTWRRALSSGSNLYGRNRTGLSSVIGIFTGGKFDSGMLFSSVINECRHSYNKSTNSLNSVSLSLSCALCNRIPVSVTALCLSSKETAVTLGCVRLSMREIMSQFLFCVPFKAATLNGSGISIVDKQAILVPRRKTCGVSLTLIIRQSVRLV
jgi:hypothetical protein